MGRGTTIADVAALAQVSTATVSRTLAAPDRVSGPTRERVLEAVRQTGYTPNVAAQSLRVARSMMVLVVVPHQVTPFFSDLLLAIDRALSQHGYGMLVGDLTDPAEQEPRLVRLAAAGRVDGLILLNGAILRDGDRRIDNLGVPIVGLCVPAGSSVPAVLADDRGGGAAVAHHFLALGHRRFGYVSGPRGNHNEMQRYLGFARALRSAGISNNAIMRFEGDFHIPSGACAGADFLKVFRPPTAVFCASDMMAMGFIHSVQAAGVSIPQDVSVAGFDGIEIAQYCSPSLTTVEQPREAMGREAARAILDLLEAGEGERAKASNSRTCLGVTLRVGASSAPPKTDGESIT
ncbi:MAG: LacI family DNA-binding transcriptional regulator [Pseudomonadota bacterium]